MSEAPSRNPPTPMSQEQLMLITELQNLEVDFCTLCAKIGASSELSLAVTNMQQASMWAARHVLGQK